MRSPKEYLTKEGLKLLDELLAVAPEAALIIGEPGMGKSVLALVASQERGRPDASINAHPKMRVDQLVGIPRLVSRADGTGVEVVFVPGLLTQMIQQGGTFRFEEISRAPGEALSRLFNVMDGEFRGWSMLEDAKLDAGVHPEFFLIATMNPTGTRLYTQPLDRALERRFAYIIEVDEPLTDELMLLTDWIGDTEAAQRVVNWAYAVRGSGVLVNTGDLVKLAKLLKAGFGPWRAMEVAVAPKYKEHTSVLDDELVVHFNLPENSPMDAAYPDAVGRTEVSIWNSAMKR